MLKDIGVKLRQSVTEKSSQSPRKRFLQIEDNVLNGHGSKHTLFNSSDSKILQHTNLENHRKIIYQHCMNHFPK